MNRLQAHKFRVLISKLAAHNNYYGQIFEAMEYHKLSAEEIYTRLPYQDRLSLQQLGKGIYSDTTEEITIEMTSGTTGVPLECPKSRSERVNLALDLWSKRRAIDPCVRKDDFFLMYGSNARKYHDFFNYSSSNINDCMQFLGQVNPRWMCGSVSAFGRYAHEIACGNTSNTMTNLQYIELQGEFVEPDVRHFIESTFHARTIVHYGNREMWTMAYECPYGHLHPNESMAYFEIAKDTPEDPYGHIIVTSFNQLVFPIIKYDTGDLGSLEKFDCPCGQNKILRIIDGRVSTIVKGTKLNGNIMMKGILNRVIRKDQNVIRRFFVEQIALNKFIVYIVKGPKYTNQIEAAIQHEFRCTLSDNVEVQFTYSSDPFRNEGPKQPIFRVCC